MAKLTGTSGNDLLTGTEANDELIGLAGDDDLRGGSGDDVLDGGDGNDKLNGESGDDILRGGAGNDLLTSGTGQDRLEGGEGDDDISAWSKGNKILLGGGGNDKIDNRYGNASLIDGGDGDDDIQGHNDDTVLGGAGNDAIYIWGINGSGTNGTVHGGAGNDEITMSTWGQSGLRATVWGDEGVDTFVMDQTQWGWPDYLLADFQPGAGGDRINLESVLGGARYTGNNPLGPNGAIRIEQSGADTLLTYYGWDYYRQQNTEYLLVRLQNVRASALTADNFAGGYAPDGSNAGGVKLAGTAGADTLVGFAMHDRLDGGAGDDQLMGGRGNDVLAGGAGNDALSGNDGMDTAVYAGPRANYTLGTNNLNAQQLTDKTGVDGRDTLFDIERLQFSDVTLALDVDGAAGKVYRLYQAAYDRKPDAGGLGFWISQADKGVSQASIAEGFIASAEFKALYGAAPSNDALVSRIYTNVLHREPDASGKAFWVDVLDRKAATVAEVLMGFSESPENVAAVAKVIGSGFEYAPWSA